MTLNKQDREDMLLSASPAPHRMSLQIPQKRTSCCDCPNLLVINMSLRTNQQITAQTFATQHNGGLALVGWSPCPPPSHFSNTVPPPRPKSLNPDHLQHASMHECAHHSKDIANQSLCRSTGLVTEQSQHDHLTVEQSRHHITISQSPPSCS